MFHQIDKGLLGWSILSGGMGLSWVARMLLKHACGYGGGCSTVTSLHLVHEAKSWKMLQGCRKGARPRGFHLQQEICGYGTDLATLLPNSAGHEPQIANTGDARSQW